MGKNANFVSHKKSKLKENGGPKLPLAADLVEGEIAINFGKDVETLSIKNESGDVVTFSSDNYYTEKKLGSGFTGENSAVTVTDAILWESGTGENTIVQKNGGNTASGKLSIAMGSGTTASGDYSVAEGGYNDYTLSSTTASGNYSHAEGKGSIAYGEGSHAEGESKANGEYSHAEGESKANGRASHAEGYGDAEGEAAHAEGESKASGYSSHAEGYSTANGSYSHAEGEDATANGRASHAEGYGYTDEEAEASHAEGYSEANGYYSHAEGKDATANGEASHSEGNNTTADGQYSHAEGDNTTASGFSSHAEGRSTLASGDRSHAEGYSTTASGESSHAEGETTTADGDYSHAEGYGTIANNQSEHASGQYNISSSGSSTFGDSGNTLFSVGNGRYDSSTGTEIRHNAFEIRQNGDIYISSGNSDIKLQDYIGSVETVTAITPSNSGSTDPIATKVVAENELTVSNALNDLNTIITAHTADTNVHFTTNDRLKWETLNRRTRKDFTASGMTYFTNTLKSAIADKDLEKYGMKVGDYVSVTHGTNTYNYVIAGLNTMRGTSTPYRLDYDHVGIIVDTNITHKWNESGNTYQSTNTYSTGGTWTTGSSAAGYANCDLHYYLTTEMLPIVEGDLGASNLKGHSKLYSTAVNTSGYNRFGSPGGCSSSWAWYTNQKICALSEIQVYGSIVWSSSGYDTGEACRQLDVFRVYNMNEIFEGRYPWLRDVASASYACVVSGTGLADYYAASSAARCVAALILFA